MQEIYTIMLKEIWELKNSKKAFVLLLLGASVPALVLLIAKNQNDNLLPFNVLLLLYPLGIAYFASMQFLIYSIIDEKKQKTLEVLMSLDIKKSSIILGKVLPVTTIAYVASIFTMLQLILLTIYDPFYMQINYSINIIGIILPIFFAFIGSNLCILTTLLFPDEKSVFSIFATLSIGIFYLISKILEHIVLTSFLAVVILSFFCFSVTLLNTYVLNKKSEIAIKL